MNEINHRNRNSILLDSHRPSVLLRSGMIESVNSDPRDSFFRQKNYIVNKKLSVDIAEHISDIEEEVDRASFNSEF